MLKLMLKKIAKFFVKYPEYNAIVHALGGIGVGILITYPFVGSHPVRWGTGFLALALLGHIYPIIKSK